MINQKRWLTYELRLYGLIGVVRGTKRYMLSYPKSGRTWVMNVFGNYAARVYEGVREPLAFHHGQRTPDFRSMNRRGITFSHGGKPGELTQMLVGIGETVLRSRRTCLLLRNPLKVLRSFYYHGAYERKHGSLRRFVESSEGVDALAYYMNRVIPPLAGNRGARIVLYEELHPDSEDSAKSFIGLLEWAFGEVQEDAAQWAIAVCSMDALRERAGKRRRLREGKRELDDPEVLAIEEQVWDRLREQLTPVALHHVERTRLGPVSATPGPDEDERGVTCAS